MSWTLPTASACYVVDSGPDGAGLVLQHWAGGPVRDWQPGRSAGFDTAIDRLPLEFSALGSRQVRGSDLIVDHGDSLVGARLAWPDDQVSVESNGLLTRLTAVGGDTTGHLALRLMIETSRDHDVVAKWVTITNTGAHRLTLPRAFGPAWELPVGPGATVDYLAGGWSREFTPYRLDLPAGEFTIGSRAGVTSHTYSPTVRVSSRNDPDGPAYGVALAWSGSWRMLVDAAPFCDRVRVAGGVDDESCVITLDPGESFTTPRTFGVYAPDGDAGVRRRWHDFQRTVLARSTGPEQRPILYNSWYATTFDVRLDHQLVLADIARELGVELFVVDDGWFVGRNDDHAGLGDWRPDPVKFPDGLDPLISGVVERGMRFGIWVEPEAVNPDSDLYRQHPEWVYRAGDRPLVTVRNQYVLDFGRPEVVTWTKDWLRTLLADSRISYLKWDMNRPVSDGGRPGDDHGRQWSVQHAEGYYQVMRMLREEFPHVTVEACAGGGARIDAAVLGLSDVVWTSDETGPRDRAVIQHGFLSSYGPHVMSSWVTDEPDRLDRDPASFEFRFVVAMAGVLGIGSDLLAWNDSQRARAAELVSLYTDIRRTVHTGLAELHGRPEDPVHAIEYGSEQQTVLLVYARPGRPETVVLHPRTLAAGGRYHLRGANQEVTGGEAAQGVRVPFTLAADTDVLIFERVP